MDFSKLFQHLFISKSTNKLRGLIDFDPEEVSAGEFWTKKEKKEWMVTTLISILVFVVCFIIYWALVMKASAVAGIEATTISEREELVRSFYEVPIILLLMIYVFNLVFMICMICWILYMIHRYFELLHEKKLKELFHYCGKVKPPAFITLSAFILLALNIAVSMTSLNASIMSLRVRINVVLYMLIFYALTCRLYYYNDRLERRRILIFKKTIPLQSITKCRCFKGRFGDELCYIYYGDNKKIRLSNDINGHRGLIDMIRFLREQGIPVINE